MTDYISRQAAIDYFVTNVGWYDEDGYPVEGSDELRKIWTDLFNGVPSAEPEERFEFGKWYDFERGYVLETTVHSFRISKDIQGKNNE